ncbi:MAG: sigma-70 family RNA polymerase sigma factor [Gemmatimonadota bacterium]|nr:sigma-70 family RNA polymerase sigma factor [Gemmatimonadota bacterium]
MIPSDLEAELTQHHRAAFGWALACCWWDRAMAEDVLQTTYLKIVDGRARYAGRSAFRTWLFGVIRRTAGEERRRRAVRRMLPLASLDGRGAARATGPDPATAMERAEASARLVAALRRLPARQREVLHLVFYQELTIAEAGAVMRVSLGTARTHYERGKTRLRALLGEGTDA